MPDAITDSQRLQAQLRYPCGDVPDPGVITNVAPGIYWLRMPLPFPLNHMPPSDARDWDQVRRWARTVSALFAASASAART